MVCVVCWTVSVTPWTTGATGVPLTAPLTASVVDCTAPFTAPAAWSTVPVTGWSGAAVAAGTMVATVVATGFAVRAAGALAAAGLAAEPAGAEGIPALGVAAAPV